jgi:hypothetical protein
MALDEKTELEYMLLTSYLENGFTGRGALLRISFDVLKQIEEGRGDFKINQNEMPKFKSFMQLDIISKIMMYIEDLAIISESFLLKRNFYDLVFSSKDLGEVIRSFFEKINCLSYEEIYKIMSYATSSQINIDDKSRKILDKHLRSNVSVIRRNVRQIGEFGTVHHPLFKRFKHAGMSIMCGNIQSSNPGFLGDFEFCNMIS